MFRVWFRSGWIVLVDRRRHSREKHFRAARHSTAASFLCTASAACLSRTPHQLRTLLLVDKNALTWRRAAWAYVALINAAPASSSPPALVTHLRTPAHFPPHATSRARALPASSSAVVVMVISTSPRFCCTSPVPCASVFTLLLQRILRTPHLFTCTDLMDGAQAQRIALAATMAGSDGVRSACRSGYRIGCFQARIVLAQFSLRHKKKPGLHGNVCDALPCLLLRMRYASAPYHSAYKRPRVLWACAALTILPRRIFDLACTLHAHANGIGWRGEILAWCGCAWERCCRIARTSSSAKWV